MSILTVLVLHLEVSEVEMEGWYVGVHRVDDGAHARSKKLKLTVARQGLPTNIKTVLINMAIVNTQKGFMYIKITQKRNMYIILTIKKNDHNLI